MQEINMNVSTHLVLFVQNQKVVLRKKHATMNNFSIQFTLIFTLDVEKLLIDNADYLQY